VLLDQLLAGLHAVHAEGIVHRDIKPANILLEATGTGLPHVRLSDFGIAVRKGEPRLTEAHFVVGTPGYFAPEQMLGADPDFPADLYAVGLVALYLLGGQRPDAQAVTERFLDGVPAAPEGVPAPLWQVLAALLQPDPQARFRTATGARKALAGAVELLPDPPAGEEPVEIFDQVGPLPEGFGPGGPLRAREEQRGALVADAVPGALPTPPAQAVPPAQPPQDAIRPQAPLPAGPPTPPQTPQTPQPQQPPAPYVPPAADYPLAPAHLPTRADVPAAAPPVPQAVPAPPVAATPAPHHRPGPPRSVVIPVLLLALVCFAVGAVALATG
jgi:eukaryotic-like serine/threonine-protein kinase